MIIGLSGKAGSGKDYLANKLKPLSFQRYALADSLKIEYAKRHGLTLEELETNKESHRQGLIDLAEKELKVDRPAFFGEEFIRWYFSSDKTGENIVITDFRYHDELAKIRNWAMKHQIHFVLVHVIRGQGTTEGCGWCLQDVTYDHIFYNSDIERQYARSLFHLVNSL